MEEKERKYAQLRVAMVLTRLLEENKILADTNKKDHYKDLTLIHSQLQISVETGLRPATLTSIFNGDSNPTITSVIQILTALKKTFVEFGNLYENIPESEIQKFQMMVASKKRRNNRKRESDN
ncbi:Helix-turn-helix [Dyadobacter koreensis]|uniref:Helix-turn-helix n=1 Tax=Dyadobacter koreensis TaxID=408657 RepID=A0A1H6Q789_9BACT|nr:helix-turn-helix transcriptional regulator [Dyadobacter koreensis]SEI39633.1 Helix-turn-helix [Dyadobacter koreensis]